MNFSRYFKYPALYALAVGAFGIGSTEFVIMGLLEQVANDMQVSLQAAGFLISGYALGVVIGAPIFTWLSGRFSHKRTLILMMLLFTLGNLVCWWAPNYDLILAARILTAFAHGTFFGVGSVVATKVVPPAQKASAIAFMFSGLTLATILGVPAGAWLGQHFGWRTPFAVISLIGFLSMFILAWFLPHTAKDALISGASSSLKRLLGLDIVLKLLTTVLAFAGFFVVFTYVQSMLIQVSGFSLDAVSAVLLVVGLGIVLGNTYGGRLADRLPQKASMLTLLMLLAALVCLPFFLHSQVGTIVFLGLLGAGAFATVAPLQMNMLNAAQGLSPTLVSSLNIAAFNLGNAFGAWLGGFVLTRYLSIAYLPWVAAVVVVLAVIVALIDYRRSCSTREECKAVNFAQTSECQS
ncbi:MFS transporter [Flavobacterium sp. W21_SRS_FM6]|uniref:MFS transporter n=1 Tax=Flavobacterium sp. W21_SRS_FM6 TaxID=3240268 RepID=UPI003F93BC53